MGSLNGKFEWKFEWEIQAENPNEMSNGLQLSHGRDQRVERRFVCPIVTLCVWADRLSCAGQEGKTIFNKPFQSFFVLFLWRATNSTVN